MHRQGQASAVRPRHQEQGRPISAFLLHAKALHGNPFGGHTLGPVTTELERQTGVTTRRIHVDKGYRGHNYEGKFRVWITAQVRRVTRPMRREMKRRAAVKPIVNTRPSTAWAAII
jgi:hypothetical protein